MFRLFVMSCYFLKTRDFLVFDKWSSYISVRWMTEAAFFTIGQTEQLSHQTLYRGLIAEANCWKNCILLPKLFWSTVRKNCSSDPLNNLFKQWKVRTIFGNRMLFFTCSWRFLIYNKLEQLEFKLENLLSSLRPK